MESPKITYEPVDNYIGKAPAGVRERLEAVRRVIHESVPEAEEKISYQMPTFFLHGNLVHFAAFKKHIGFYPAPCGLRLFKRSWHRTKGQKAPYSFRSISRCRLN